MQPPGVDHLRELAIRIQATAERVVAAPHEVLVPSHLPVAETLVHGVIIHAVVDDALSPDFPLAAIAVSNRRRLTGRPSIHRFHDRLRQ
jgi:phosphohistidine phosphatase SixA